MAITFAYRSDSLVPRFVSAVTQSIPFRNGSETLPSLVAAGSDVGVIGPTVLDVSRIASNRSLRFVGVGNWPDMTGGLSVLTRLVPRYTGSPSIAAQGGIWIASSFANLPWGFLIHNTNGTFNCRILNPNNQNIVNYTTTATWSATSGTVADIGITWDGTTGSNQFSFWVNGSVLESTTASQASTYSLASSGNLFSEILPCNAWALGYDGLHDLNEMVIWDNEQDFSSYNGSSRTAFVDVVADDAFPVYTDPGIANVALGTDYTFNDTELTGTLLVDTPILPDEEDVRLTRVYGYASELKTGTLNVSKSNALRAEIQSNDIQVKVRNNE